MTWLGVVKIFHLPGDIFRREGPSRPLSLEELQRYLTRFHPRRLLELLAEGGHLSPEESVEPRGSRPDEGVVYRVTVNVFVAHCAHAVATLQLVGELPSCPEKLNNKNQKLREGGREGGVQPVEKYRMEYREERLLHLPRLHR